MPPYDAGGLIWILFVKGYLTIKDEINDKVITLLDLLCLL